MHVSDNMQKEWKRYFPVVMLMKLSIYCTLRYTRYPLSLLFSRQTSRFIYQMLQPLKHFHSSLPYLLQYVYVFLILGRPELDPMIFLMQHKKHKSVNTGGCQSLLQGHIVIHAQLVVHQDPQVLLCQPAFQLIIPSQMKNFAFFLVEIHESPFCHFLQPAKIPLNVVSTIWWMNYSCSLCTFTTMLRMYSVSSSRMLMRLFNSLSPLSFQSILQLTYLVCNSSVCQLRCCGK